MGIAQAERDLWQEIHNHVDCDRTKEIQKAINKLKKELKARKDGE